MSRSLIGVVLASSFFGGWFAGSAFGHPASGIVVNARGEVFFIHTGRGVGKIDSDGKFKYIHEVRGGGHFLALDAEGRFATQFPRLFESLTLDGARPTLLYASGGAPLVVNRDGNLYYGSGFPDGDDSAPGFHTVTRLSQDGKRTLFAPDLKRTLADLNEGVMGLAAGPDGSLFVSCPNAVLKVATDGKVETFVHPVVVRDCEDNLAKDSDSRAFHSPYLRGLAVTDDGTVYAAVTGCRCVVKITPDRKIETVLKAEQPWAPTGVAVRGKGVFVLEYTNPEKEPDWSPRVRRFSPGRTVATLVDLSRDENTRKP